MMTACVTLRWLDSYDSLEFARTFGNQTSRLARESLAP